MMFKPVFIALFILLIPTTLVFSHPFSEDDTLCCPEVNIEGPDKPLIRPIVPLQRKKADPIRSLSEPDAIIVPGYAAGGFQSPAEMIAGRVAGVWVSGGFNAYTIRIRGALGPPLIVIDDMPFYSARTDAEVNSLLQMVPTLEVGSIEVLKNIGRTAIYGGHGGNGVIRINTKGYLQARQ